MTNRTVPEAVRGILALIDARSMASEDLLARYLADRDPVAFRVLMERYAGVVARRCRSVLRQNDLAEDAFQETFLRLVTHGHAVRRAGRIGAWLAVTAVRVAINVRTRAARRRRHEMVAGTEPNRTPPADPADTTTATEIGAAVVAELSLLPDRYRLPLEHVYLDGMTHAETAQALGLPKGTVDSAVARGLERLRAAIDRRGLTAILAAVGGLEAVLAVQAQAAPSAWTAAATQAATAVVPRSEGLLGVLRAYLATRPVFRNAAIGIVGATSLALCAGLGFVAVRDSNSDATPRPTPSEPVKDENPPEEPLPDRNRRVLEADTLPRVIAALRPMALNGGDVRVTQLVVHDFRAQFEIEIQHKNAPVKVTATHLRFFFDTRRRFFIIQIDEWGTGRFRQLTLDKPIVLFRIPELNIETVLRSEPLDHAAAILREFPPDPRAEQDAKRHCEEVVRALAPYRGRWRVRGNPAKQSPCLVSPDLGPDDDLLLPGDEWPFRVKSGHLEIGTDGRVRIWWDPNWYQLSDGGRRLELKGTGQWWEREPDAKSP